MKQSILIFLLLVSACSAFGGKHDRGSLPEFEPIATFPSVTFQNTWIQHNVFQNGRKGMKIFFRASAKGLQGRFCKLYVYFYTSRGYVLQDRNNQYKDPNGNVMAYYDMRPAYNIAQYDNIEVFMPYAELHIEGKHQLTYRAFVYSNGSSVGASNMSGSFTVTWYTQRNKPQTNHQRPPKPRPQPSTRPNVQTGKGSLQVNLPNCNRCQHYKVELHPQGGGQPIRNARRQVMGRNSYRFTFRYLPPGSYDVRVTGLYTGLKPPKGVPVGKWDPYVPYPFPKRIVRISPARLSTVNLVKNRR